jgi:hypothetical protein
MPNAHYLDLRRGMIDIVEHDVTRPPENDRAHIGIVGHLRATPSSGNAETFSSACFSSC